MSEHKLEHKVERADRGEIFVDGWCYRGPDFSIQDVERAIDANRKAITKAEAVLDFLRAEESLAALNLRQKQDEELAMKLHDAWNGCAWEQLGKVGISNWLNVARVAREHFGGEA